ncbi:MAG: Hsp20/alpha crystallin family protein [Bacteroidota bacterium]
MTLIKWNKPNHRMERRELLAPSIDNLLNDFFNDSFLSREFAGYVPAVNLQESENAYQLEVSAPGFTKEDFSISFNNGELEISGEHKSENSSEEKNYTRKEFSYGSFRRSFAFSEEVEDEKISAKYENGILKIELPKIHPENGKKGKQIMIS